MARIRVESDYHEFYRVLSADDGDSTRRKIFATMKDVFMLALGFGVTRNLRTPLAGAREIFEDTRLRPVDWDIIRAAAVAGSGDGLDVIENDAQLVRIAEEYANTGIRIIKNELLPSSPEKSVALALINAYKDARPDA